MLDSRGYYYDYVNAVVCDPGSQSFRVGMARHRAPTVEIASTVGVPAAALEPGSRPDGHVNARAAGSGPLRYDVDITSLCVPREGVEMVNCVRSGMIDDWDLFEKIFDYAFANYVRSDPRSHPLLFTESPVNHVDKREQLAELMFEKYRVPSIGLYVDAVLAAFAFRGYHATAVVVDSGATHTSVVPVHEGYVMSDHVLESPVAGNFISAQCQQFFDINGIDIVPRYMVGQTRPVKPKESPIWAKRTTLLQVTKSWHRYMCDLVVQDFKHSVLEVCNSPYDENIVSTLPTSHYTFPNGYNQEFGKERFKIPESLFEPNPYKCGSPLSISKMVTSCIEMCEENLRPTLYENIIVIGGNSLLKGFTVRLSEDIYTYKPKGMHMRMIAPLRPVDRQYGAWLGGSLIATDNTTDDLWFSSREYYEYGKSYVNYKCPY